MREIVHMQAGQCGNQIGAKVSAVNTGKAEQLEAIFVRVVAKFASDCIDFWREVCLGRNGGWR